MLQWIKHAFAVEDGQAAEPTSGQREAIDRVLKEVVRRRLTVPARMLLETCRPLNFVGAQLLHFFSPLMKIALGTQAQDEFAEFLERRASIDFLLRRLDALETPADSTANGPGGDSPRDTTTA